MGPVVLEIDPVVEETRNDRWRHLGFWFDAGRRDINVKAACRRKAATVGCGNNALGGAVEATDRKSVV